MAVLDTGVDPTHPDLVGRVVPGWNALTGGATSDDTGNDRDDDGDDQVDEMTGHGTHVAGIIAQVAPGARIMPVKVLDSDGVGDAFYVAAGVFHALDNGADVINLSLGSTRDTRIVADAVGEAVAGGIVVVAAAGNFDRDQPVEFPAATAGVIGVAATDAGDRTAPFSNYGDHLLVSAPGTDIVSAAPGGGTAVWSGTSMATPFVAGSAALLVAAYPDWHVPTVVARLALSAAPLDAANPDYAGLLGAGRIDTAAAIGCRAG